jgi:hypothetical protein
MAYLGIKESELKGLYYFSSLAMGESIGEKIENSIFYLEGEKKKALKEFNLAEADIKDGRILMDKFRNTENEMAYIAIEDTPFAGVYCFKRRAVRDREAKNFPNAYLSMDKAEMLAKYNISESEIRDGGYLMSGEVKNYLKKKKANPPKTSNPVTKEIKTENTKDVSDTSSVVIQKEKESVKAVSISDSNVLRNMIDVVAGDSDVVEIQMSTGDKYRVALRKFFYAEPSCTFENCAYTDGEGNVAIKQKAVDAIIDSGAVTMVEPSKIKYGNGFVTIRNCDDEYSPDILHDKMGKTIISHSIDRVVLNVSQVVSVKGFEHYTEINMNKITPEKNMLIHTYLMDKFKSVK